MSLHHAAIFVADVDRSVAFYGRVLGLEETGRARIDALGVEQAFLSAGERQADLVVARKLDGTTPSQTPGDRSELFHLAFELRADEGFDAFVERMGADEEVTVAGGPIPHPSRPDGSGSRDSLYLFDPDGHLFEVTRER